MKEVPGCRGTGAWLKSCCLVHNHFHGPDSSASMCTSSIMSSTLSRKQQKAQAFKSKQKAKRSGKGDTDQPDVPEVDLDDEQEPAIAESSSSKKRKRLDTNEATSEAVKGKGKAAVEEDKAEKPVKKSKKEVKQRFILFVGQ